jgi:hypothetical protein
MKIVLEFAVELQSTRSTQDDDIPMNLETVRSGEV